MMEEALGIRRLLSAAVTKDRLSSTGIVTVTPPPPGRGATWKPETFPLFWQVPSRMSTPLNPSPASDLVS